jgi:hypothetical protein
MIPPDFLCLPIFSNFNFVMLHILFLIFEIFLANRHSISSPIGIVENILTFGYKLVPLELPKNSSSIITTTCKERTNTVPSHTIHRLFVIAQFRQFSYRLDFFFFKQALHSCYVRSVSFTQWIVVFEFLACVLIR